MSGDNPYAGAPGVTGTDQAPADRELAADQMDVLRRIVAGIASRMGSYPLERFAVGSELSTGANGPPATVAVHPPVSHPVSAGFSPDADDLDAGLTDGNHDEVARGLATSAAFQVMSAVGDNPTPAAR